jgi:hypothetical protein
VGLVRLEQSDLEEARGLVPGVEHVAWIARLPSQRDLARGEHGPGLVLIHDLRTFLTRAESSALANALAQGARGEPTPAS